MATWIVYLKSRDWAGQNLSDTELAEARSAATIALLVIGLVVLVVVSRPLRLWKVGLAFSMAGLHACIIAVPFTRDYFELEWLNGKTWLMVLVVTVVASVLVIMIQRVIPGILPNQQNTHSTTHKDSQ